jgi:dephospho-CoA kinase
MTKLVGITGGIGSGKTTFSNHLKKLGYLVHESDVVVSEIILNQKNNFLVLLKKKFHKML